MMKVSLIVAMDKNHGIGKNNDLLWHLPEDMKFFRTQTTGHIVVMGRKNWDSIPEKFRPLPNRINVVLSRSLDYKLENAEVYHSLESCLQAFAHEEDKTIFIIGGGEIYRQALALNCIDEMFITHVDAEIEADTFFPEFSLHDWHVKSVLHHQKDEKNPYSFEVKHYLKQ